MSINSKYSHKQDFADVFLSRRSLLSRMGNGFAGLSLSSMLATEALSQGSKQVVKPPIVDRNNQIKGTNPLAAKLPPLPAKAKRVIFLFMNGGPSHVDTWDPKPKLTEYAGKTLPINTLSTERKTGVGLASPFKFKKYGQSGIEVSELFEKTAKFVDEMAVIRSMHADVPNHEPSLLLMNCGEARQVRPSFGSWSLYGLGTENQNLPGFIAMCPGGYPIQETQNWQSGFLPGIFAGTYIDPNNRDVEKIVEHIRNRHSTPKQQREQLDILRDLNKVHAKAREADPQLESRIQSFELGFRMQTEATEAFNTDLESEATRDRYGSGKFARACLIGRRLAERGVRFVQIYTGEGQPWDLHDDLEVGMRRLCAEADRGISSLLEDLKERGMLEETLVIWGGEFGRTPAVEMPTPGANAGKMNGRDHNHWGFTYWMAGGGVKKGTVYGATDDFGFKAEDKPVHVHDFHATVMRLLGFDHTQLTYRYAGRDFRLTDVHGNVIADLIG